MQLARRNKLSHARRPVFPAAITVTPAPGSRTQEPFWRAADHPALRHLQHARHWLLDDGSLTQRLQQSGQTFSVQRLQQRWQVPAPSERHLLHMRERQRALVREVALRLDGQAVVFARSVFPFNSLSGALGHLRRLQNSSLGAILFGDPQMLRSPFEVALIHPQHSYIDTRLGETAAAWGRRSVFLTERRPLLVSEVFLQAFEPWPRDTMLQRSCRGRVSTAILRNRR